MRTGRAATLPSLGHPLVHVLLAHVEPYRFAYDAAHDGVGVNAIAEPGVPVGLLELDAGDRRHRAVAQPISSSSIPRNSSSGLSNSHSSSMSKPRDFLLT